MTNPDGDGDVPVLFKVDDMIRAALVVCHDWTPRQFEIAARRVDRVKGPWLLVNLARNLTESVLAFAVPHVWSAAEYPDRALPRPEWRHLFDRAGYTVDGVPSARPSEPVRLYRGAVEHPVHRRRDWSWTDNRELAEAFAFSGLRGRPPGVVWTMLVPPSSLLARIHESSRRESEYVVDTRGLRVTRPRK